MRLGRIVLLCVLSSVLVDASWAGSLPSKSKRVQRRSCAHEAVQLMTVHFPIEVLLSVLFAIPFQQRCRLCLVSHEWRDAVLNGPLPCARRARVEELPQGEIRNFLLRRSVPILPTLEFDDNENRQRYRLSPRETGFGSSLSEACRCGTICIIHQRNFLRGSGAIGGGVSWWGVSRECRVLIMARGSLLFFFAVRSEIIHGRQDVLTETHGGQLSSDPAAFLENVPLNLIRRYDAGFNIARGRIIGTLLYLVPATLEAMLIINLAYFRS